MKCNLSHSLTGTAFAQNTASLIACRRQLTVWLLKLKRSLCLSQVFFEYLCRFASRPQVTKNISAHGL